MELLAPIETNVCVFRYIDRYNVIINSVNLDHLNYINEQILYKIQESGIAAPSGTRINGNFGLRIANVNQRSTKDDFDILFKCVLKYGNQVVLSVNK